MKGHLKLEIHEEKLGLGMSCDCRLENVSNLDKLIVMKTVMMALEIDDKEILMIAPLLAMLPSGESLKSSSTSISMDLQGVLEQLRGGGDDS